MAEKIDAEKSAAMLRQSARRGRLSARQTRVWRPVLHACGWDVRAYFEQSREERASTFEFFTLLAAEVVESGDLPCES